MSEVDPIKFGIGVSGWKARQNRARQKMVRAKSTEERAAIRQARAKLYAQQADGEYKEVGPVEKLEREPIDDKYDPTAADEVEMTREEMIKTLKDAGQTVGPNTKDETLAKRVEALYEAETETPDSAA